MFDNTARCEEISDKLTLIFYKFDNLHKFDTLVTHGNQNREEKYAFIKHFATCDGSKMNSKALCATSGVANAGIDCKQAQVFPDWTYHLPFGT